MVILKELQLVLMPTCFISIPKEVFGKNRANNAGRIGGGGGGGRKDMAPPIFGEQKQKRGKKGKNKGIQSRNC